MSKMEASRKGRVVGGNNGQTQKNDGNQKRRWKHGGRSKYYVNFCRQTLQHRAAQCRLA